LARRDRNRSLNDAQIQNPSNPFGIVPLSNFVQRGFGFVHHSIAILYHQVPNPNITIRNFFVAVHPPPSVRMGWYRIRKWPVKLHLRTIRPQSRGVKNVILNGCQAERQFVQVGLPWAADSCPWVGKLRTVLPLTNRDVIIRDSAVQLGLTQSEWGDGVAGSSSVWTSTECVRPSEAPPPSAHAAVAALTLGRSIGRCVVWQLRLSHWVAASGVVLCGPVVHAAQPAQVTPSVAIRVHTRPYSPPG
jgi:hypothetical protein